MGATGSLEGTSALLAGGAAAARSFRGLPAGFAAPQRRILRRLAHDDLRSILQLVKSSDRQGTSGFNSLYLRHRSVRHTGRDGGDGGGLVRTDHIDKSPLGVALNGWRRNQRNVVKRIDEQAGIHELARKQGAIRVG